MPGSQDGSDGGSFVRVTPDLDDLFPTRELREAYDDSCASLEAGRLVRRMRRTAGLTQADLAAALGVSQARVSAVETGEGRDGPSYAVMSRIARACGIDLGRAIEGAVATAGRPAP